MEDVHASRRISSAVGAAAVGAFAVGLTFAGSAQAASCAQVSISPGVQSPSLSPKTATIVAGGCVAYTNNTALPVKVTVRKLSGVANPNTAITFIETIPGTFAVSAQEQFQGQPIGGTGTGTLVVKARPAPKPSPHPSSTSPSPHPSPSSGSAPPSATPTSSGPVVATGTPTQAPPTTPGLTPAPNQSGQGNPPVIVGMPPPTATPSVPSTIDRAQLQPPSGRATGLPAAIAALLIVGAGAAFVRVLLAEPAARGAGFIPRAS